MRKLLLIAVVALSTTACGVIYKQPIYQGNLIHAESVAQLQVGQSKQQVNALLGTPSIPDPFHAQRWDYTASQRIGRSGAPVVKNMTLHFENEALASWEGEYFPEQDSDLAKNSTRYFGQNLAKDKDKKGRR